MTDPTGMPNPRRPSKNPARRNPAYPPPGPTLGGPASREPSVTPPTTSQRAVKQRRPPALEWSLLMAAAALAAAVGVRLQFGPGHGRDVAAGWAAAALYAALVAAGNRQAVGGSFQQMMVWGLGLKALGLSGLVLAVLLAWNMPGIHLYSFVFSLLAGYLAALTGEIRGLWRQGADFGTPNHGSDSDQHDGGPAGGQERRAAGVHHAPHDELARVESPALPED